MQPSRCEGACRNNMREGCGEQRNTYQDWPLPSLLFPPPLLPAEGFGFFPVGLFPAEAGWGDFKELDVAFGNLATHQSLP